MWRNVAHEALSRRSSLARTLNPSKFQGLSKISKFAEKISHFEIGTRASTDFADSSFGRDVELSFKEEIRESPNFSRFQCPFGCFELGFRRGFGNLMSSVYVRAFATSVEAVSAETDEDKCGIDEIQDDMVREENDCKVGEKKRRYLGYGISLRKYQLLKKRQVKIETEAWERAAKEYKELLDEMCKNKLAPNLPYMKMLFLGWFEPLCNRISAEQELCRERKLKRSYAPFMDQLPAETMSVITMHKLMGLLMTGGEHGRARVLQAACHIGEAIENEARIHKFLDKTKSNSKKGRGKEASSPVADDVKEKGNLRNKVLDLMKKQKLHQLRQIVKRQEDSKPWGQAARIKVGTHLLDLLMQTAYIQPPVNQAPDSTPDIRPAFKHSLVTSRETKKTCKRYGVIECDPLIKKGLERTVRHMVIPYMPMLVPPVSWTGFDQGAYFFLPSYIMRTRGVKQQREAVQRASQKQLSSIFEALDTLGGTKWRINIRVLSVIERLWASGGGLAGLVDCEDVPIPEKPDTEDEAEIRKWKWLVNVAKKENSERHSQRCDTELKLAVARKMKEEDGFFYPHNLDFRGRAYPMHPYLNHLGSDLCRGILEFAEGRPLGKSGLRWLKIHMANLYAGGVDKLSLEGRITFTENHLDDIFDSAENPLEGRRWWLGAEDPFQCLAACINISAALRSSSPETAVSHLPVHQDGSCNGLQHYAALGRDTLGATAVNLVDGEKPADVYSGIAARVLKIVQQDALKEPATSLNTQRAKLLIDQVDRKLVKQTVMTSVYGVTYIGARQQIKRRLKERGAIGDDTELFGASCYAAKTTLAALGEMFQGARSIMGWLSDCAKVIASENQPVQWVTPLGLPVVQPYRKLGRRFIKTSLQTLTLQRETDKVLVKRQRTAFPPNFIHSLDGSHMMMTAIACKRAGLNFAGVHDSYWTHACDVDTMNRILREKFEELYEKPILENLLESFQQSFPGLTFPPLPKRGNFDMKEVLGSTYFFN
ncbi:hypothetical protein Scep_027139 [Stephania cephalantha]|uniref:DNA-directed RNA polymerase n=1 Tax=Stephania cephalantha TaxID=152367 RepID=A0AAP0HTW3_9MAGN